MSTIHEASSSVEQQQPSTSHAVAYNGGYPVASTQNYANNFATQPAHSMHQQQPLTVATSSTPYADGNWIQQPPPGFYYHPTGPPTSNAQPPGQMPPQRSPHPGHSDGVPPSSQAPQIVVPRQNGSTAQPMPQHSPAARRPTSGPPPTWPPMPQGHHLQQAPMMHPGYPPSGMPPPPQSGYWNVPPHQQRYPGQYPGDPSFQQPPHMMHSGGPPNVSGHPYYLQVPTHHQHAPTSTASQSIPTSNGNEDEETRRRLQQPNLPPNVHHVSPGYPQQPQPGMHPSMHPAHSNIPGQPPPQMMPPPGMGMQSHPINVQQQQYSKSQMLKPQQREAVEKLVGQPSDMVPPQAIPQRRNFFEQLVLLNDQQGKEPLTAAPQVSKTTVDLHRLYIAVRRRGGFEQVTKDKMWKQLCVEANPRMTESSAAGYQLRRHYLKYLLALECQETGQNKEDLEAFADKLKKKKKEKEPTQPSTPGAPGSVAGPPTPSSIRSAATPTPQHTQQQQQQQQPPPQPSPSSSVGAAPARMSPFPGMHEQPAELRTLQQSSEYPVWSTGQSMYPTKTVEPISMSPLATPNSTSKPRRRKSSTVDSSKGTSNSAERKKMKRQVKQESSPPATAISTPMLQPPPYSIANPSFTNNFYANPSPYPSNGFDYRMQSSGRNSNFIYAPAVSIPNLAVVSTASTSTANSPFTASPARSGHTPQNFYAANYSTSTSTQQQQQPSPYANGSLQLPGYNQRSTSQRSSPFPASPNQQLIPPPSSNDNSLSPQPWHPNRNAAFLQGHSAAPSPQPPNRIPQIQPSPNYPYPYAYPTTSYRNTIPPGFPSVAYHPSPAHSYPGWSAHQYPRYGPPQNHGPPAGYPHPNGDPNAAAYYYAQQQQHAAMAAQQQGLGPPPQHMAPPGTANWPPHQPGAMQPPRFAMPGKLQQMPPVSSAADFRRPQPPPGSMGTPNPPTSYFPPMHASSPSMPSPGSAQQRQMQQPPTNQPIPNTPASASNFVPQPQQVPSQPVPSTTNSLPSTGPPQQSMATTASPFPHSNQQPGASTTTNATPAPSFMHSAHQQPQQISNGTFGQISHHHQPMQPHPNTRMNVPFGHQQPSMISAGQFPPQSLESLTRTAINKRRPRMAARDYAAIPTQQLCMALRCGQQMELTFALNALTALLYDDTHWPPLQLANEPQLLSLITEHLRATLAILYPKVFTVNSFAETLPDTYEFDPNAFDEKPYADVRTEKLNGKDKSDLSRKSSLVDASNFQLNDDEKNCRFVNETQSFATNGVRFKPRTWKLHASNTN
ncbi:ARID domain-containing protein [Aphelenchoides besseyi]|nr:ARID domain-containing protein [Aphelenchoides besseyi]